MAGGLIPRAWSVLRVKRNAPAEFSEFTTARAPESIHGRPRFAKHPSGEGTKVKIAAIYPAFGAAEEPLDLMGSATGSCQECALAVR